MVHHLAAAIGSDGLIGGQALDRGEGRVVGRDSADHLDQAVDLAVAEDAGAAAEQERLTNMFTNILKKFHDTEMAVIRNI